MELDKGEFNKLCANFGMTLTENMNKTLAKLGFVNIGDMVHYLEEYKK